MVVEDEESFVDALTVGLKREGFLVHAARDGAEALALFDATHPDIVLLDVMLPKVSGVDVCRELRSKSRVPIIMVTAKGGEIDTVVGLEVGADDYVTKPYRLRELVARMRAVLRRAPPPEGGVAGGAGGEGGDPRAGARAGGGGGRRRGARGGRPPARRRAPRGLPAGRAGPASAQGVRAAGAAAGQRRPGVDPRHLDRPDLGAALRGRHQDARRPRQ